MASLTPARAPQWESYVGMNPARRVILTRAWGERLLNIYDG